MHAAISVFAEAQSHIVQIGLGAEHGNVGRHNGTARDAAHQQDAGAVQMTEACTAVNDWPDADSDIVGQLFEPPWEGKIEQVSDDYRRNQKDFQTGIAANGFDFVEQVVCLILG